MFFRFVAEEFPNCDLGVYTYETSNKGVTVDLLGGGPVVRPLRTVVEDDFLGLGYPENVYDAIVAFYAFARGPGHYNQYKGAALGASQGVRPLGSAGYVGIPMDYDPLTWNRTLEHELMHVLSQLFRESTYPAFPEDILHNPQLAEGAYDSDDTWLPWLDTSLPSATTRR